VVYMLHSSSWPGPIMRQEDCKIADRLSMKICITWPCNRWRQMYFQHIFKHSSMAHSSASKTSKVCPIGITTRTSCGSPYSM
jgi:hypothetical protein